MPPTKSQPAHFVKRPTTPGAAGFSGQADFVPNTDVYATEHGVVVKIELAGVRSENVQISVEGNMLRISGERPDACRAAKCNFLVMEINYGTFESILELPPGYDLTQAKATYLNGFLRLDIPLAETPAPHKNKDTA